MRKILIAIDGENFSEGALQFAAQLNERTPILLIAAFLPQTDLANLWSYAPGDFAGNVYVPLVEEEVSKEIKKNMDKAAAFCVKHHIEYRIHTDFFDLTIPALKKESRFADLLVISSSSFYQQAGIDQPNAYLQQALHEVECPVIIVGENFHIPDSNVLAYDGSESSVYAIKQFAYLLPELTINKTVLVFVRKDADEVFPDELYIEELAARHFTDLTVLKVNSRLSSYQDWLKNRKRPILVSGAYGRSGLSRFFKKSFIHEIIGDHTVPVFIAHI